MSIARGILVALLLSASACRRSEDVATKDTVDAAKRADAASVVAGKGGDSYFPLVVDAAYEYDAEFEGKKSHAVRLVRGTDAAVGRVFYFVDEEEASNPNPIVGTESFGLGAYRVTNDAIETAPAFWLEDVAAVSAMQTAVQLPPVKGATVTLEGTHELEVRVVGPETLSVPAGTFSCVRLDEREIWPDKVYEGAVWLARGVGVVKRVYTTGRTEVLTRVRFP